jgi:hypothetical protein
MYTSELRKCCLLLASTEFLFWSTTLDISPNFPNPSWSIPRDTLIGSLVCDPRVVDFFLPLMFDVGERVSHAGNDALDPTLNGAARHSL